MNEPKPPEPPESHMRASDVERDRVVEALSEHAASGRLTLAELEERAERALHAKTHAELEALTRDLPAEISAPKNRRKARSWFVAIMSGSNRHGRFRLGGSVTSIAIMGGDNIDLREAEIDDDEVDIYAFSLMGGTDIYVPDTVEVVVDGFALMGGDDQKGSRRPPRPGAPVVRIHSYAIMGGMTIWRLPAEARGMSLREARRAAKALGQ